VLPHSLSREPLAKYFGVLVDEEVLDGILVTLSGGRLRECPASSYDWYQRREPNTCDTGDLPLVASERLTRDSMYVVEE
jgi:hypothetical protein